jgi:transcription antitermination factor NusG
MYEFVKATCNKNEHLLFVEPSKCHYKSGELVKVIDGPFVGVKGRVARISGQQRVVISLTHIGYISTAYIPTAFLQKIGDD